MRFLKDKIFTGIFGMIFSTFYAFVAIFVSLSVVYRVGGANFQNYEWLGVVVFAVMVGVPIFVWVKYFKEIPDNMSREQMADWGNVEQWIVPDAFYLPKYWIGVIALCVSIFVICMAFNNYWGCATIPGIFVMASFVYLAKSRWRKSDILESKMMANWVADYRTDFEARSKAQ
ncbi:MAG: hypothetical protein ABI342_03765 [Nitrososphaera sp.]|jgi:hypothetical protein